ncbi:MAG: histidinol dehydrogenase, partial [Verrucomicrobiae bacterium]|nr:histidinol dehydrogenase [Verrucomicrobiae bacterium]
MARFTYGSAGFFKRLSAFAEDAAGSSQVEAIVADILEAIKTKGDKALFEITERLDGARLNSRSLRVSESDLKEGAQSLSAKDRRAILESIRCVKAFNQESLPRNWNKKNPHGAT